MSNSNESGLGLFDDAASAAGSFPTSLRGYDRSSVDEYVRTLETAVVQERRRASELEEQAGSLQEQLKQAAQANHGGEPDYSKIGGRASDILRLAEEQAREVLDHATQDAEKIKETARRDADRQREEAAKAGGDFKSSGVAEVKDLRVRGQKDVQLQLAHAKAEAEDLVAAARRQAESLQRAADHEAQTSRETAYLDTEKLRRTVESEVAQMRAQIAVEREAALNQLRSVHEEAVTKTSALLAEAAQHNQESAERLDLDITEAARVREAAMAEAERIRAEAHTEADERVTAARKQAAAITDRTQQEFAWRKQQLRRETDLLGQRKQAVLNQLASLSALAQQTATSFPDLDDLDDFGAEQGDQTVMVPPHQAPALPAQQIQRPEQSSEGLTAAGQVRTEQASAGDSTMTRPDGPDEADVATMEIDGDATIMVPVSQLPAGTAHLSGESGPQKD